MKREAYPRAKLTHKIEVLDCSSLEWLVRLNLSIKNDSDVLMRIFEGHTWIQQVEPWPDDAIHDFKEALNNPETAPSEASWPLICETLHNDERELEPGEPDDISMDFFISKTYKKILIYSFIKNESKPGRNLGWMLSTVLDLAKSPAELFDETQGQTTEKPRPKKAHASNH